MCQLLNTVYNIIQYNKYTPVFHSPVNCSSQKHSVRHGDGAGNDDTGCSETSDAMFARHPAVEGLGDEVPGQRSWLVAGPTQVTRTSGGCRQSEAVDVDDDLSVAGRDLHRASRIPVHQRERNCSSTPPHTHTHTHAVQSAGRSPT